MTARSGAAATFLADNPVIAVLRAGHARQYPLVISALLAGGVRAIELTLSTDGVFAELPSLIGEFGHDAVLGLGTVTDAKEAETALECGARFLVTPTVELDVIHVALEAGVPVLPGGLTPTELHRGWAAGASAVKLFPASTVGPGYLGQLRGPFPDMQVVPSGGVGVDDARTWIDAGAAAVSLGGPLIGDAFAGGDLGALTERALRLTDVVRHAFDQRKAKV